MGGKEKERGEKRQWKSERWDEKEREVERDKETEGSVVIHKFL